MLKKMLISLMAVSAFALAGCGDKVSVGPAEVGKVFDEDGYRKGLIPTSSFRLDACPIGVCQKLITLDVSDFSTTEEISVFMPKDRLKMSFDIKLLLSLKPDMYDEMFNRIPVLANQSSIPSVRIYQKYAQSIILSEAREFMPKYTIMEVANNREEIGRQLTERITEIIEEKTPYMVKYSGLADVRYPKIIVDAQEQAARRREEKQQELAQVELTKVRLEGELKKQEMQRKIDVEKARADAEVNKIMGESMTDNYKTYRMLEALDKMASSNNTKFIPVEMLSSMAGQTMLGNQADRAYSK